MRDHLFLAPGSGARKSHDSMPLRPFEGSAGRRVARMELLIFVPIGRSRQSFAGRRSSV